MRFLTLIMLILILSKFSSEALNVDDFGAQGDTTNYWADYNITNANGYIAMTNAIAWPHTSNEWVQVIGVGKTNTGSLVTGGTGSVAQDYIGIVTNVVFSAPNHWFVYVTPPMLSINSNFSVTIGTNDYFSVSNCVAAAGVGSVDIIFTSGKNYQLIPPFLLNPAPGFSDHDKFIPQDAGILIYRGGLNFKSSGTTKAILTSVSAFQWDSVGGSFNPPEYLRAAVMAVKGPITNDFPLTWDNLDFYGNLRNPVTGHQGSQARTTVDGLGWDGTSAMGYNFGIEPLNTFQSFNNCNFHAFMGEMIKGITGSAWNETILVTNCFFYNGNATAFNYNFAHTITGCLFSNMFQIEEFYLQYPTNAYSYFVSNFVTNMSSIGLPHSVFALNGGTLTNMNYIISNNVINASGINGNIIGTSPACNLYVLNNLLTASGGFSLAAIAIGTSGYQGSSINSNSVITGNTISGDAASTVLYVADGDGPTSPHRTDGILFNGNTIIRSSDIFLFYTDGWSTNVNIVSNNMSSVTGRVLVHGDNANLPPYPYMNATNNTGFDRLDTSGHETNTIGYYIGARYLLREGSSTDYKLVLDTNTLTQMPNGAQMYVSNSAANSRSVPIYFNNLQVNVINLPVGGELLVSYFNGDWTNTNFTPPTQPTNYGGTFTGTFTGRIIKP